MPPSSARGTTAEREWSGHGANHTVRQLHFAVDGAVLDHPSTPEFAIELNRRIGAIITRVGAILGFALVLRATAATIVNRSATR